MPSGMHHYHRRKRVHVRHGRYPSRNKWKNFMDCLIYLVAVLGPLVAIPQIWKIWIEKSAVGVSVFTWGAFIVGSFIWLIYGAIHKEKPIIVTNILWIIMEALVIGGIVVYS